MRLGLYSRRVSWLNRLRPIRPSSAGTRFMWSRPVDDDPVRRVGYPEHRELRGLPTIQSS